jgi:predicted Zn-dependent protease
MLRSLSIAAKNKKPHLFGNATVDSAANRYQRALKRQGKQSYMRTTFKVIPNLCCYLIIATSVLGCATNPVTGKSELSIISANWELQTGKQNYLPMRQSQGGDYVADPQVQAYVREVGNKLAAVSDRKLPYEFCVVNDSTANAWALPGGKIAVHRGLLTELKSEAELAAVLSHEIVHAAAKHGAKSMQRGMLLQSTMALANAATENSSYSKYSQQAAELGASLISTKYSRDAERESDLYGMNYMYKAGYDPMGAVDLQQTFVKFPKPAKTTPLADYSQVTLPPKHVFRAIACMRKHCPAEAHAAQSATSK